MKPHPLAEQSLDFAVEIVRLCDCIERHETEYWLQVLLRAEIAPKETILPLLHRSGNIRRMLISSLNTAKK